VLFSDVRQAAELEKHGDKVMKDIFGVGSFSVRSVSSWAEFEAYAGFVLVERLLWRLHNPPSLLFACPLTDIARIILELLKYVSFGTGIFFGLVNEILVVRHSTPLSNNADILKPHPITEPPEIPDIEL
jgi:hypothetical protein